MASKNGISGLRQRGFGWIMSLANRVQTPHETLIEMTFKEHPFGLPMFGSCFAPEHKLPIKYLRHGDGILTVGNLPILIARELDLHMGSEVPIITGLRVIESQYDPREPSHHLIHYEVATPKMVYMVHGATDCSGHGGQCKEHLDAMFAFLSELCDVKIESVEIPYQKARLVREWITNQQMLNYKAKQNN